MIAGAGARVACERRHAATFCFLSDCIRPFVKNKAAFAAEIVDIALI
jgi:hypothetical protein